MKTHKHHIVPKARGGSDDPCNLTKIDFIEHALLHAIDFIDGGLMFDCRHEGWPYLDQTLRDEVKKKLSQRASEINRRRWKNQEFREEVLPKILAGQRKAVEAAQTDSAKEKRLKTFCENSHAAGKRNSQFGTMWITNGVSNLKIRRGDSVPDGYWPGRKIK